MCEGTHHPKSRSQGVVIALTGAQGVGKSTLGRLLVQRSRDELGLSAELLVDAAGEVRARGLPLGLCAGPQTIRAFAEVHEHRARGGHVPIRILDRCLLDTLGYATVLRVLDRGELEDLKDRTARSLRSLDLVVRVPITTSYRVTSELDEDLTFRRRVDAAIRGAATELGVALLVVDPRHASQVETVFERLREACHAHGFCAGVEPRPQAE